VVPETQRGTGKAAAWGVVAGISGSGAFGTWIAAATIGNAFPLWPAWALGALTTGAVCMCFKPLRGWPLPLRRARGPSALAASEARDDVGLIPEPDGVRLRLLLRNNGKPAELSVQVIAVRDPLGRAMGPQHWTIPWLDDSSTEPKRMLCGQTRILDFARYNPAAVQDEIQNGRCEAPHWQFPAAPHPVAARYYNLRSDADLNEQRFQVTVRLLNASLQSFTDYDLAVGVHLHEATCTRITANESGLPALR
jgi:hypothetical protein